MVLGSYDLQSVTDRAFHRLNQFSDHLILHAMPASEIAATSDAQMSDAPSNVRHDSLSSTSIAQTPQQRFTPMTGCLPGFEQLARVAGLAQTDEPQDLQYMRAPSVGHEYIPVPLFKMESATTPPAEFTCSPDPSTSASPTLSASSLPSTKAATRQSPPCRVEKKTKAKSRNLSIAAEAFDQKLNLQIDEIQRPYRDGEPKRFRGGESQRFPRLDRKGAPRGAKRIKTAIGSSEPKVRHNNAQTFLRGEKGSFKMQLQRLLVNGLGWRGTKLQTKVNARSSGLLYEERELLQANTQALAIGLMFLQACLGPEGMHQLGSLLKYFEPEDVQALQVERDAEDDDDMHNFKCQAARVQVIAEASQPLGLKNVDNEEDFLGLIGRLMPIANSTGKIVLQKICQDVRGPQSNL